MIKIAFIGTFWFIPVISNLISFFFFKFVLQAKHLYEGYIFKRFFWNLGLLNTGLSSVLFYNLSLLTGICKMNTIYITYSVYRTIMAYILCCLIYTCFGRRCSFLYAKQSTSHSSIGPKWWNTEVTQDKFLGLKSSK